MTDSTMLRTSELDDAEEWIESRDLVERAFSFGGGQVDARTGYRLRDRYVVIVTAPGIEPRSIMLALFGREWCGEYESEAALLAKCGHRQRRYAYIRIGCAFEPDWADAPRDV